MIRSKMWQNGAHLFVDYNVGYEYQQTVCLCARRIQLFLSMMCRRGLVSLLQQQLLLLCRGFVRGHTELVQYISPG